MKKLLLFSVLLSFSLSIEAQRVVRFESTVEAGTLLFAYRLINVDPSPTWRGYYLPQTNDIGIRLTSLNSVVIHEWLHTGLGVSYVSYAGINGLMIFTDFRIDVLRSRFSPFLRLNPGYTHFWNQYEGGTGTGMLEIGLGARYKLTDDRRILASFGPLFMQQHLFLSGKLGFSF